VKKKLKNRKTEKINSPPIMFSKQLLKKTSHFPLSCYSNVNVKTKILCTLGPASARPEILEKMMKV
jgi:hypothetical protein